MELFLRLEGSRQEHIHFLQVAMKSGWKVVGAMEFYCVRVAHTPITLVKLCGRLVGWVP